MSGDLTSIGRGVYFPGGGEARRRRLGDGDDTCEMLVASHSAQNQANRCGSSDRYRCRSSCSVATSDSSHACAYLGDASVPVVVRTAVEGHDGAPSRIVLYVHGRHSKSTQVLHASHAAEDGQWDFATP